MILQNHILRRIKVQKDDVGFCLLQIVHQLLFELLECWEPLDYSALAEAKMFILPAAASPTEVLNAAQVLVCGKVFCGLGVVWAEALFEGHGRGEGGVVLLKQIAVRIKVVLLEIEIANQCVVLGSVIVIQESGSLIPHTSVRSDMCIHRMCTRA